ncbi:hypothetical protein THAOC_36068 [Thalassiosira oceanica]|uniref:Uncharacterized protein n=1 Tax=Thalassiosira oceanica TaxID=159749 RepID=K0R0U1_THAOC|nr:hypothetical protein THAOC_36068 [Thalassiosira oceanica]|eukprot:EJK45320.1 hypothetical protein THAOC_36068 [Thalassiosira oceanica]
MVTTHMRRVTESSPFDQNDDASNDEEHRWTWFFNFETLPPEEESEEGDVTSTAGATEAVKVVTPSGLGRQHEADQPVSEPKPAPADPIDQDVEMVLPVPPVPPPAPDVARQIDPLSVIPSDASTGTRDFEIGLTVTTVKGDENSEVIPDIEAQTSKDLTIVEMWSDESNDNDDDETEADDNACVKEGGGKEVPDIESEASEAPSPALTCTDFSGWPNWTEFSGWAKRKAGAVEKRGTAEVIPDIMALALALQEDLTTVARCLRIGCNPQHLRVDSPNASQPDKVAIWTRPLLANHPASGSAIRLLAIDTLLSSDIEILDQARSSMGTLGFFRVRNSIKSNNWKKLKNSNGPSDLRCEDAKLACLDAQLSNHFER